MVYVLYDKTRILGIYENIELLKANCFIYNYKNFKCNRITEEKYFSTKNILLNNLNLEFLELEKIMEEVDIFIEFQEYEKNGLYALQNILRHIDHRFNFLEEKLSQDARVTVKFPGRNALDNKMVTHNIEENWRLLDLENYHTIINELKSFIIKKIQKLELNFSTKIRFGTVSDKYASDVCYQVWPADKENWNLPVNSAIPGEDFAVCFEYQKPGVFGIVTDPKFGYTCL